MTKEYLQSLDEPRRSAVTELTGMIQRQYPGTSFAIGPGEDDPRGTYIVATVDTDDPDEVTDLTIERELALQVDEGVPVYVIPIRTPERTATQLRRRRSPAHSSTLFPPSQPA